MFQTLPEEHIVQATIGAAIAARTTFGKGDKALADSLASNAMRQSLSSTGYNFVVAAGEGERDNAPLLMAGEKIGKAAKKNQLIELAIDPLEGTSACAAGLAGAMCVIAAAPSGGLMHIPDLYMEKMAVGKHYPGLRLDLNAPLEDNLKNLAGAKKCKISELKAIVLDRTRHKNIIETLKNLNIEVKLIPGGDIEAIIDTTKILPELGINHMQEFDLYLGTGGAPEGLIAASFLRCCGGQMVSRLVCRNEKEKDRAAKFGISDFAKTYKIDDMASSDDIFFSATALSDCNFGGAVKYDQQHKSYLTTSLTISTRKGAKLIKQYHDSV